MRRIDAQIKQLCEAKGYRFHPGDVPPWDVDDDGPSPWPVGTSAIVFPCWPLTRSKC